MVCTTTSIWHAAQPVPHSCRAYCRTAANVVRDRLRQPSACSARSLACHALAGLEAAGRCRCSSITFLLTVRSCCLLPCAWRDEHAFRENGTTVSPRPLSSTLAGSTSGVCTAPVPAIPNLKASSDLESSNPAPSSAQGMTPRAAHLSPVLTQASWVKRPRKRRRWLWSNKKQGSLLTGRCFSRFEENSRISVFFMFRGFFSAPAKHLKLLSRMAGKSRIVAEHRAGARWGSCASCRHSALCRIYQGHPQGHYQAVAGRRKRRAQRELHSSSRQRLLTDIAEIKTESPAIIRSWRALLRHKLIQATLARYGEA